jgi:hypothetical protein
MATEDVEEKLFAVGQPHGNLVGYSRTEDVRVTETILGEAGGARILLRRQTSALPTGETVEFCQRCWIDIKSGVTTCVPIPCPKSTGPAGPGAPPVRA